MDDARSGPEAADGLVRLQKELAARGVASRRRSEELIREGRVRVNGKLVTELGAKVDPDADSIYVDGKRLRSRIKRYLLLNKPKGYITTMDDERDRWTVMDLINVPERVYPVGRLDRDTEGLLLLTNDGDLANRVMHPRYGLRKEYSILTPTRPAESAMRRVNSGIELDGRLVRPDEFRILRETRDGVILIMILHEGMNRVVRRLMEAVGVPVEKLRRVRIGPLSLGNVPTGVYRDLSGGELRSLREAVHLDDQGASTGETPRRVRAIDTDEQAPRRRQPHRPRRKPAAETDLVETVRG